MRGSTINYACIWFFQDIKSILPYAGAALLGIAAALVVNPSLLHSISGRVGSALGHGHGGYSTGSYGGSSGGYGNSGYGNSGYGHGSYAHHHGRKRREAAQKFAQNLAYTQSKRNWKNWKKKKTNHLCNMRTSALNIEQTEKKKKNQKFK
jgi:hypothetical protein